MIRNKMKWGMGFLMTVIFGVGVFSSLFVKDSLAAGELTLEEAQLISENYLMLLKEHKYAEAYDALVISDPNPGVRDINVLSTETFHEVFGQINNSTYQSSKKTSEYAMTLFYEIEHDTMNLTKEIYVIKKDGNVRVERVRDDTSSPEALKKMIELMRRIVAKTSNKKSEG